MAAAAGGSGRKRAAGAAGPARAEDVELKPVMATDGAAAATAATPAAKRRRVSSPLAAMAEESRNPDVRRADAAAGAPVLMTRAQLARWVDGYTDTDALGILLELVNGDIDPRLVRDGAFGVALTF